MKSEPKTTRFLETVSPSATLMMVGFSSPLRFPGCLMDSVNDGERVNLRIASTTSITESKTPARLLGDDKP